MKVLTENIIPFLKSKLPSSDSMDKLNSLPNIKSIGDNLSLSSSGVLSGTPAVEKIASGDARNGSKAAGTGYVNLYASTWTLYEKVELILECDCASTAEDNQIRNFSFQHTNGSGVMPYWAGYKLDSTDTIKYSYRNPAGETDLYPYWHVGQSTPMFAKFVFYPPSGGASVLNIGFEAYISSIKPSVSTNLHMPIVFNISGYLSATLSSLNRLTVESPATVNGVRYTLYGYKK